MNTTKEERDLIEPWEQEYKEYLESQECEEDDEYEDDEYEDDEGAFGIRKVSNHG